LSLTNSSFFFGWVFSMFFFLSFFLCVSRTFSFAGPAAGQRRLESRSRPQARRIKKQNSRSNFPIRCGREEHENCSAATSSAAPVGALAATRPGEKALPSPQPPTRGRQARDVSFRPAGLAECPATGPGGIWPESCLWPTPTKQNEKPRPQDNNAPMEFVLLWRTARVRPRPGCGVYNAWCVRALAPVQLQCPPVEGRNGKSETTSQCRHGTSPAGPVSARAQTLTWPPLPTLAGVERSFGEEQKKVRNITTRPTQRGFPHPIHRRVPPLSPLTPLERLAPVKARLSKLAFSIAGKWDVSGGNRASTKRAPPNQKILRDGFFVRRGPTSSNHLPLGRSPGLFSFFGAGPGAPAPPKRKPTLPQAPRNEERIGRRTVAAIEDQNLLRPRARVTRFGRVSRMMPASPPIRSPPGVVV